LRWSHGACAHTLSSTAHGEAASMPCGCMLLVAPGAWRDGTPECVWVCIVIPLHHVALRMAKKHCWVVGHLLGAKTLLRA
jgi:hypothetical protein